MFEWLRRKKRTASNNGALRRTAATGSVSSKKPENVPASGSPAAKTGATKKKHTLTGTDELLVRIVGDRAVTSPAPPSGNKPEEKK